jgi:PAS domain S-box-containing protein
MASIMGAILTYTLVHSRRRAVEISGRMTKDLRVAEAESHRLALVASRTATGVILMDSEWKVEWVNDSFTRLFGYSLAEVKGRSPEEFLIGPNTRPDIRDVVNEACEQNRSFEGEVIQYTKSGSVIWVEL